MKLPPFRLEKFFSTWEFKAPYLLCCSDAEGWEMSDIIELADAQTSKLWSDLKLSYTEVPGLPLLRAEIAGLYEGLSADDVLCFAGAEEGIYCAARAMLGPGDHAIAIRPCYQSLEEVPRACGAEVTTLSLREEDGWEIDLAKLEELIQSNTRVVFINYPHNPTGKRLNSHKQQALIETVRKRGIAIFSDEVYRLLGPRNDCWESPISSLYEKGISLGVMSKAFGLAGLRVGWLACRDKSLIKNFELMKHYTSICNSAPSEVLALIGLRARDKILLKNNEIVRQNYAALEQFIARHDHLFSWVRPEGGCVGFVKYQGSDGVQEFCERLVHETGVLLMPGSIYDWREPHFRIGFGRKNMPDVLNRLENYLEKTQ